MSESTPVNIRVPIKGQLLIKLDGFTALHEVGTFEKELNVAFSTAGGNIGFTFDKEFWAATIEDKGGRSTDPQPNAGLSTYSIILKVLEDNCVPRSAQMAEALLNTLGNEGRLA